MTFERKMALDRIPDANDEKFLLWMDEVDKLVSNALELSVNDLPDVRFRDAFDNGSTPAEFVEEEWGISEDGDVDWDALSDIMFG